MLMRPRQKSKPINQLTPGEFGSLLHLATVAVRSRHREDIPYKDILLPWMGYGFHQNCLWTNAPPLDESSFADLEISPLDARRCISSLDFFDFESSYHLMNFLEKFKNAVAFGGCIDSSLDSSIPPNSNDIVHPVLLNDTPNQKIIKKSLVVDTYGLLCGLKVWHFFSTWGSMPFGLSILPRKGEAIVV